MLLRTRYSSSPIPRQNWLNEIKRWTHGLTTVVVRGSATERDATINEDAVFFADVNIVLTTFEAIVSEQDYFERMRWQTLVIDEAHRCVVCAKWEIICGGC